MLLFMVFYCIDGNMTVVAQPMWNLDFGDNELWFFSLLQQGEIECLAEFPNFSLCIDFLRPAPSCH